MSHWDSKAGVVVRWPSEPDEKHPGWTWLDCGCSNGLQWGGDEPVECGRCDGLGLVCRHDASGRLALYPGGPFVGRELQPTERESVMSATRITFTADIVIEDRDISLSGSLDQAVQNEIGPSGATLIEVISTDEREPA